MSPIRSALPRSLRSQLNPTRRGLSKSANRELTATSKTVAPLTHNRSHQPASILPSAFRLPLQVSHQITKSTTPQSPIQRTPFTDLLNALTRTLTTTNRPSLPLLHTLLRSYSSDPTHWARYAHANPEKQYTRNLVFGVPRVFNLLLLVWTPGQKSPVHDHADAHCLMKVLKGEIRETRYATPERPGEQGPLVQTSRQTFGLNKVAYMADQLGLHSIANPHPTEYAVSLHLYTPPNAAMRGCNVFNEENGEAKHVMQCTYDSVEGTPNTTA